MPDIQSQLTEAYNLVFDVKDVLADDLTTSSDAKHYAAYEAVTAIARLMATLGIARPVRFDGTGRVES